jgi:hypothetical protein
VAVDAVVVGNTKQQHITTDDLSSYEVRNTAVFASWERFVPTMLEFKTVTGNMAFTTTAINFADIYAGMHTVLVKNLLVPSAYQYK